MKNVKKFFKNFKFSFLNILKVAGVALVALILLGVAVRLISPLFDGLLDQREFSMQPAYDYAYDDGYYEESFETSDGMFGVTSSKMSMPEPMPPMVDNVVSGNNAEDFEVTEYNAFIETRDLEKTCGQISELKAASYVIFENASEYEQSCYYNFKVEKAKTDEVLAVLEGLDPKELSENVYTIKKVVENLEDERTILERKRESISKTLNDAVAAYDELSKIAKDANDVESLTKVIDSKIQIIERLTQENIYINERIDRIEKSRADQMDRLKYSYFYVDVFENKYIDGDDLKQSWKNAVKEMVSDTNEFVQNISLNLIVAILYIVQYVLYFFILLFVVKYGWKATKAIWKK